MRRFGTLLSLLLLGGSFAAMATRPAPAAVKEFPYEAVIEADEAYVRCGPGKNFYTTLKLTRGQHVTVRRHDPGGWFMIDPPAGSFSLIRMEDVVQQGKVATVKRLDQGQASVRIGSSLDPTADSIFQRKLSTGERVEILGEVIIPRKDRQVPMFRIRPPRGEFRWIEGSDLAPLDPQIKQQQESDPFSTPPEARQARRDPTRQPPTAGNSGKNVVSTGSRPTATTASVTNSPRNGSVGAQQVVIGLASFDPRGRLDQIDGQFRDMIQKEPPTWNLSQIEQAYLELRQNPAAAGVVPQVDLRFSALAHYKQVKSQYDDYYRLVSSTSRRDAELAAVESSLAPQNSRPAVGPIAQGGFPSSGPSGDVNYQTPTQGPTVAPTLSVPNYSAQQNIASQQNGAPQQSGSPQQNESPQFNAAPNVAPQEAPSQNAVSQPLQQEPSEDQNHSRSQSGLTLGAPVPAPAENRSPANAAPSQPPVDSGITSVNPPTAPNTLPPTPSPVSPRRSVQDQVRPYGGARSDSSPSDLGIKPFPGEIGPGQNSGTPQPPTYTSQFGPSATGTAPSVYPRAASSPAVAEQAPGSSPFNLTPGQPAPPGPMGPASPMQNQFSQQNQPAQQNQPYFSRPPAGANAPPFVSQQPAMQPGGMQPAMPQSGPQPFGL
ncbi:MAG TPA: hypothetical protein VEI07_03085, partial [Planctomycetaceae bacterium]|nr:hypothetical protein [Planctomycetaceae bacterium]